MPDVGTTIFSIIGALAARHHAINLSQGAPNFACNPVLIDLAHQAMLEGHNQYSAMEGLLELRAAIAAKAMTLYGRFYRIEDEVTITASASEALFCSLTALVHPGDDVIFFEPAFDSYAPMIRLQGATPVAVKMSQGDFTIPWDEVAARLSPRTRMMVINSPHNPSGAVLGIEDIKALERLTAGTGIIILSDEVYEHMLFDGALHHSMSRYPALAERSIVVGSFGKSFHVTGWRVGYCLAPAELMQEIRKTHQFAMFCADTPMQVALAKMMESPEHYLGLSSLYQEKRDFLFDALRPSRFKLRPSAGGFFILADYAAISDEPDTVFVTRLIEEFGVATLPVSAFYGDRTDHRLIRLSFSKTIDTLRDGAARLCRV